MAVNVECSSHASRSAEMRDSELPFAWPQPFRRAMREVSKRSAPIEDDGKAARRGERFFGHASTPSRASSDGEVGHAQRTTTPPRRQLSFSSVTIPPSAADVIRARHAARRSTSLGFTMSPMTSRSLPPPHIRRCTGRLASMPMLPIMSHGSFL